MKKMFRVNEQKRNTEKELASERKKDLETFQMQLLEQNNQLTACKDCDEWSCVSCDNEGCPGNDKEPGCLDGDCDKSGDLNPECKDCDEWLCVTCDNEK